MGSWDKKLYAINPNGTKKWEFETGGEIESSPAIGSDGTIYVGSWDHKFYALNPNGTKKWEFVTGGCIESSPAIGLDGTIYVGLGNNNLYAFNPDGTKKWEFVTGSYIISSPAIGSDGTIYVGSADRKLYAIGLSRAITATAGTGGSISPSGSVSVAQGGNQSFTIAANAGYHIADVRVDGTSVGAVSTYAFSNVTADHTISATFALTTTSVYTITATPEPGGVFSP